VFAIDDLVEPLATPQGVLHWLVWGTEQIPVSLPTDGGLDFERTRFPLPHGARVAITEFPPKGSSSADLPPDVMRGDMPGDNGQTVHRDASTGMHMTNTIDIVLILEGEIGLEQSDGAHVLLKQGDILIQNGADHAWRRGDQACRVALIMLGAERRSTR
jgi:hypothetical protein